MTWDEVNTIVTDLTDANTTDFPTATRLIYANNAGDHVAGVAIGADGRWQFDDTNFTNLPIGTTDIKSGQQQYQFDDSFLTIQRLEVTDSSGNVTKLTPIDEKDISIATGEYKPNQGIPSEYDKIGDSIFLYATPNYDLTGGLKAYFQRSLQVITSFDSTVPGFYLSAHMILPYMIALPYCQKYKKDRVALYEKKIAGYETMLVEYYGRRAEDEKATVTPLYQNNR